MSGTFKPTLLFSTLDLGCCKVTHLPLNIVYEGLHRETGSLVKENGIASCWLFICCLCVSISLGSLLPHGSTLVETDPGFRLQHKLSWLPPQKSEFQFHWCLFQAFNNSIILPLFTQT